MKELADGVWQLDGFPPNVVNTYLLQDVLIDAGMRYHASSILRQLQDRDVVAHALTHAHPDHQGSSHEVCSALGIPFWVGERDADAAEDPRVMEGQLLHNPFTGGRIPPNPVLHLLVGLQAGPGHPVTRRLRGGDEVAGFEVLDAPGHSAGQVAFWRESDRVLIAGDVVWNIDFVPGVSVPGLIEPPSLVSVDPALNRASARRLAELEPSLVCFGHGPPLRDTRRFVEFVAKLSKS
jgi:glyoxylase-like metal-dependent hydrolase (beta-lactamase superfamily II)